MFNIIEIICIIIIILIKKFFFLLSIIIIRYYSFISKLFELRKMLTNVESPVARNSKCIIYHLCMKSSIIITNKID